MKQRQQPVRSIWLATTCLLFGLSGTSAADTTPVDFCSTEATDFCPTQPSDISEFEASFIYRFIANDAQLPFDRFSWQAFLAAQWPYDTTGQPLSQGYRLPYAGKARWQYYATKDDTLNYPTDIHQCSPPEGGLVLHQYHQATGEVLVDSAGNYVLYETRLSPVSEQYILTENLATAEGRALRATSGIAIEFPLESKSGPGAQLLKFAWKILTDKDEASHYLVKPATIAVAASDSLTGQPQCLSAQVGLVGMHLVQRVRSGNGDQWIWSTFEHNSNVPLAGNARNPNKILARELFPEGCEVPANTSAHAYSFYTGAGPAYSAPSTTFWAEQMPYARNAAARPIQPANLVRCWQVFEGTKALNQSWHAALAGTVWEHYFLVGTQWIGNGGGDPFGTGEVPRFLSNTALESFIQHQDSGTCLGCHDTARTDAGQLSNLTFVLSPS